ncbi:MAG: TRAP transporter small permease [bacterium]
MSKYFDLTKRLCDGATIVLFLSVLILQSTNIFLRYTQISAPWMWVEEMSRYAFIWILFLLWHQADRTDSHFAVDLFGDRLPRRIRGALAFFYHAVAIFFSLIVIWSSFRFIPSTMMYHTASFSWLPMGYIYLIVPIGCFLVFLERLILIWERFTGTGNGES